MTLRQALLFLIICLLLYCFYCSNKSVFIRNTIHQQRTNFLVIGIDSVQEALHSDTVIFVSYSPKLRQMDIVSIPRDTYVNIEEFKYRKIAEVFAGFYYKTKDKYQSSKLLTEVVENKLFFLPQLQKKVEIPYFLVIDYTSFKKLIDLIGKIKIVVTEPMHYDDNAGGLHIHFEPGVYYMNGQQALEFVRYRDRVGDIGRIVRQQQFIKNFIQTLITPKNVYKIPTSIYNFKKSFITNINLWEMLNMLLEFRHLKLTNIRFATLTGKNFGRYLELDQDVLLAFLSYIAEDKNLLLYNKNKEVLLKIYNATDKPKIAKQVAMFLRQQGYDVLDWGNWYCKQPNSKIIDCSHNKKIVDDLCNLLNIYDVTSIYSPSVSKDTNIRPVITIVLGEDFYFVDTSVVNK